MTQLNTGSDARGLLIRAGLESLIPYFERLSLDKRARFVRLIKEWGELSNDILLKSLKANAKGYKKTELSYWKKINVISANLHRTTQAILRRQDDELDELDLIK